MEILLIFVNNLIDFTKRFLALQRIEDYYTTTNIINGVFHLSFFHISGSVV